MVIHLLANWRQILSLQLVRGGCNKAVKLGLKE